MSELNKIQQDNMSLSVSNYLLNKECDIKRQLYRVLGDGEIFWVQKARVNWLPLGDKNTRYFQTITNIRKKKNKISSFRDHLGNW